MSLRVNPFLNFFRSYALYSVNVVPKLPFATWLAG